MNVKIVSLDFDHDAAAYDVAPLEAAVGDDTVTEVGSHLVFDRGQQRLVLILRTAAEPRATAPSRPRRVNWRTALAPEDFEVFEALREWRNRVAQAASMAPFLVMSNRILAAIAERRPRAVEDLLEIDGIGRLKADRFGQDALDELADIERRIAMAEGVTRP